MVAPEDCDNRQKGWWERLALLQYATLRTTNAARSLGGLPAVESQRALLQAAFEGAEGSQVSCQIGRATPQSTPDRAAQAAASQAQEHGAGAAARSLTAPTASSTITTTLATTSTPSTSNVSTSASFRHYFNIFLLS